MHITFCESYTWCWYSEKNGPLTKWTRQKGPRFKTKRTTSENKTDHGPGQNGPGFRTKLIMFLDITSPVLGQTGPCKKIHDVLQRSEESSQYPPVSEVTGRFGPIPIRTPGRFGPIPFWSGCFGLGRLSLISGVGRFSPILVGRFGPLHFIQL